MIAPVFFLLSALSLTNAAPGPVSASLQARSFSTVNNFLTLERAACVDLVNALNNYNGTGATLVPEIQAVNNVTQICRNVTSAATDTTSTFTTANGATLQQSLQNLDGCFQTVVDFFIYKKPVFGTGFRSVAKKQLTDLRQDCYVAQPTEVLKKTATTQRPAVSSVYAKTKARFDSGVAEFS